MIPPYAHYDTLLNVKLLTYFPAPGNSPEIHIIRHGKPSSWTKKASPDNASFHETERSNLSNFI